MSLRAIVLAAGKGTRMHSELPKVLHLVNGVTMLGRIKRALYGMGASNILYILGHKKEQILESFDEIDYVVQENQLGTGHAVLQTYEKMKDYVGDLLLINGDMALIEASTLKAFYENHKNSNFDLSILSANLDCPQSYGRVVLDNVTSELVKIVEERECKIEEKKITLVNVGAYIIKSKLLYEALSIIEKDENLKHSNAEIYLTDIVGVLKKLGYKIGAYEVENSEEIGGVNSKYDLYQANKIARKRKNRSLMEMGVNIVDSENCYIEDDVIIGEDSVIYPNVVIEKNTVIGKNCKIFSGSRIENSTLGDGVLIKASYVESSIIEDGASIGPFAHIRPNSLLKKNVRIGNFVEVKKSVLEDGVKAGHLSYLGDTHIGKNTNIGAGTITCNYDGKNKHKTEIGEGVFVGSDSIIVAPVTIGNYSTTAAGSVITKDVPENSLAVERNQQKIIENWRKK